MNYAPGSRVKIRDAEWIVRRVDRTLKGGYALSVVGLSELVKDTASVFLTDIDKNIEVIDPLETSFVADTSTYYRDSMLYIESLLRTATPPNDDKLYIGHTAAMDTLPFQLEPTIQALQEPRQRILIADTVGLGKTLEAGILVSELIRRGKGKRILVLTVKSMLTQFQKEFWSRFTIPLTRLDSVGIQRVRAKIPSNHNPFYYYDKSIISIDTLKQENDIRISLEKCYWDIIVIDEAHNVAERGTSSLRAKLAKLLSARSDTLIMLSATPHDGKAKSFASLMNMLNPTAITNPEEYGPEDIKGLYIRRFKKDVLEQLRSSQKDRKVFVSKSKASNIEETCYDYFTEMQFSRLDKKRGANMLFKTTLEKSLFSSPSACISTVNNRIKKLEKEETIEAKNDISVLKEFIENLDNISPNEFSKYVELLKLLNNKKGELGWTGKANDRIVIFTERIDTLSFLYSNLITDLKLQDKQIEMLHGGLSDIEQQKIVEEFGKEKSKLRILVASDVASEGINLHYLSHKMIHFDIPWSLMAFQQRNGRIDRYGQPEEPHIAYLITESENEKIKGDTRILELLIQKDQQAEENIGDPSVFMKVYDIEAEENWTAKAMEEGKNSDDLNEELEKNVDIANSLDFDPFAILAGDEDEPIPVGDNIEDKKSRIASLYSDDFQYFDEAINYLKQDNTLQYCADSANRIINFTATEEVKDRFKLLPKEVMPENGDFHLTDDRNIIMDSMNKARKEESSWPKYQLLWEQHPIMEWVNDKVISSFGRQEAPVLTLNTLDSNEVIFIASGLIPNKKGHPIINHWLGVKFINGKYKTVEDELQELIKTYKLNPKEHGAIDIELDKEKLNKLLPIAVEQIKEWITLNRDEFNDKTMPILEEKLKTLERLRASRYEQLEFKFAGFEEKQEKGKRDTDKIFDEYKKWIEDTMKTEDNPYIRIIAVLQGSKINKQENTK